MKRGLLWVAVAVVVLAAPVAARAEGELYIIDAGWPGCISLEALGAYADCWQNNDMDCISRLKEAGFCFELRAGIEVILEQRILDGNVAVIRAPWATDPLYTLPNALIAKTAKAETVETNIPEIQRLPSKLKKVLETGEVAVQDFRRVPGDWKGFVMFTPLASLPELTDEEWLELLKALTYLAELGPEVQAVRVRLVSRETNGEEGWMFADVVRNKQGFETRDFRRSNVTAALAERGIFLDPTIKFCLSEKQRFEIWQSLCKADHEANEAAEAAYPLPKGANPWSDEGRAIASKQSKMFDELRQENEAEILKKWNLTPKQLTELSLEAREKHWSFAAVD